MREVEISLPHELAHSDAAQRAALAKKLHVGIDHIKGYRLLRRSLDARKKNIVYRLRFQVSLESPVEQVPIFDLHLKNISQNIAAIVVGSGPAGLFAALKLIELGIKPILLERGKSVRERRFDIAHLNKQGSVHPDSNYAFGEGGAGTFSDGKLYTRATKRGSLERILNILVAHGASPEILIDAHPHIGTNRLPSVIQAIRQNILAHGGEVHFESKVIDILHDSSGVRAVRTSQGDEISARAVILATGHSARDIFELLYQKNIEIQAKPYALGVRVEHPQALIDEMQYRISPRPFTLPAASYGLVTNVRGRGVFSFCMCPGGIICPAATATHEVVVNGWSPSKRNSFFANSGIVVQITHEETTSFEKHGPLAGMKFQQSLEEKAFLMGGGNLVAPAQRLTDFLDKKPSQSLPKSSYLPGISSANLHELFPDSLSSFLSDGFRSFHAKRRGFISEEAVLVAVESRTSSPVRIPRDPDTYMHPGMDGLFPTGEGAGYAGGIMSAAMDGEKSAIAVSRYLLG